MALCALILKAPWAGDAASPGSAVVSHRTRSAPVSLVNDSVCRLPWPDHEPSWWYAIVGSAGLGGGAG